MMAVDQKYLQQETTPVSTVRFQTTTKDLSFTMMGGTLWLLMLGGTAAIGLFVVELCVTETRAKSSYALP